MSVNFKFLFLLFFSFSLYSNPFAMNIELKDEYTFKNYQFIQNELRGIDVSSFIDSFCENNPKGCKDFMRRCTLGENLELIDDENNKMPEVHLLKIGKGSDRCIVSYCSHNKKYSSLIKTIAPALSEVGFDGYLLYQIGGFPNPSGIEMQYAGVPYSFKIFMMLEAQKRGFNKVLWVDSALIPFRNPSPIFDWIEQEGVFVSGPLAKSSKSHLIPPATRQILEELIGIDVLNEDKRNIHYVLGGFFGFLMNSNKGKKIIEMYYLLVDAGLPFISRRPEEFVLTAIINSAFNKKIKTHPFKVYLALKWQNSEQKNEFFFLEQKH